MKDIKEWTKDDFIQAHRELWWKIAEMTIRGHATIESFKLDAISEIFGKDSENYYRFVGCLQYRYNSCFACCYASRQNRFLFGSHLIEYYCMNCPLEWPNNEQCRYYQSLYNQWMNARDYNRKAELAAQIANLPVRED